MEYQYKNMKLNYEVIGNGKPIIILHGLGCELNLMKSCLEPIFQTKTHYKRFYIDLPGMGKSGANLDYASSDKILEILKEFINNFIDENFFVIGESYGGYLARGVLTKFVDRIDGMMLLCPVIIPQKGKRALPPKVIKFTDSVFLNKLDDLDKKGFCEYAVVENEQTYKRYCEEISKGVHYANSQFINRLENNYSFSFDVDECIRNMNFDKPVLFICGKQDNCVGYEDAWKLSCDYSRATFSVLDVAGHNLQIEQPILFKALVDNWLVRTEDFA